MAAGKKTGGRGSGTPNKPKPHVELNLDLPEDYGPEEFLDAIMRNPKATPYMRAKAAKDLMPYKHPTLQLIQKTSKEEVNVTITDKTDLARRLAFILKEGVPKKD